MYYLVWITIIILLIVVELLTVNLTTIWFVASGIVALALSFITDIFLIQFACFVILGVVLLIFSKPFIEKIFGNKKERTNLDRIIGMTGIVTQEIKDGYYGEVKVDGKNWTAYADTNFKKNQKVVILEINSSKIKVGKVVR